MQQKVLAKKGILYGLATIWGVLLTINTLYRVLLWSILLLLFALS